VSETDTTARNERKAHRRGRVPKAPTIDEAAARRAVYDGRDRLGEFVQSGSEYIACDRQGRKLGVYDSAAEAIAAICSAAARLVP
jgi:hypothetical protein